MRKVFALAVAVLLALAAGSTVSSAATTPTTPKMQIAYNMAGEFRFENSFGVWFWGDTYAIGLNACRVDTPVGYLCFYEGFW